MSHVTPRPDRRSTAPKAAESRHAVVVDNVTSERRFRTLLGRHRFEVAPAVSTASSGPLPTVSAKGHTRKKLARLKGGGAKGYGVVGQSDAGQPRYFAASRERAPDLLVVRLKRKQLTRLLQAQKTKSPSRDHGVSSIDTPPQGRLADHLAEYLSSIRAMYASSLTTAVVAVVDDADADLAASALANGADEVLQAKEAATDDAAAMFRVDLALAKGAQRAAAPLVGAGPDARVHSGQSQRSTPLTVAQHAEIQSRIDTVGTRLPSPDERMQRVRAANADLLSVLTPELRSAKGLLDANKVAERLQAKPAQLARALGVSKQRLAQNPAGATLQDGLEPIARVIDALANAVPEEHFVAWLNARHALLDEETPLRTILDGGAERVALLLDSALNGGG